MFWHGHCIKKKKIKKRKRSLKEINRKRSMLQVNKCISWQSYQRQDPPQGILSTASSPVTQRSPLDADRAFSPPAADYTAHRTAHLTGRYSRARAPAIGDTRGWTAAAAVA